MGLLDSLVGQVLGTPGAASSQHASPSRRRRSQEAAPGFG